MPACSGEIRAGWDSVLLKDISAMQIVEGWTLTTNLSCLYYYFYSLKLYNRYSVMNSKGDGPFIDLTDWNDRFQFLIFHKLGKISKKIYNSLWCAKSEAFWGHCKLSHIFHPFNVYRFWDLAPQMKTFRRSALRQIWDP